MKIDLHTHILPPNWPDLRERFGYGGWPRLEPLATGCARMMIDDRFFREVSANSWDPAVRIAECDRLGVDVQVLSTVPVMFSYWARPHDALDFAQRLNDHIAEVCRTWPRRFAGLATLPMQDAALAARELERCVRTLGLCGVQIGTNVNGVNLEDRRFDEFYAAAESLGAAVFVHPWQMLGAERTQKYWSQWLVGMPAETSLAICCMIFGGVFERYPRLRVAFAHGGGAFAGTYGRIARGFAARPDLCAVDNPRPPGDYLGRFYVDSLTHDGQMLRQLLRLFGEQRVALGSDYPFPLGEERPGALIESLTDLTPGVRDRLLSGTALEFLGAARERFE